MFFYRLVCFHCEYLKTQKYEKGVQTIAPKGNFPLVRFRVWLTVSVRIRVGGQFSSGEGKLSQNLRKCCSLKKQHVWAETVLKSWCRDPKTLLSVTEVHVVSNKKWFLLTLYFHWEYLSAEKFKNVVFQAK